MDVLGVLSDVMCSLEVLLDVVVEMGDLMDVFLFFVDVSLSVGVLLVVLIGLSLDGLVVVLSFD